MSIYYCLICFVIIRTKVKGLGYSEINDAISKDIPSYLRNEIETNQMAEKIMFDNAGKSFLIKSITLKINIVEVSHIGVFNFETAPTPLWHHLNFGAASVRKCGHSKAEKVRKREKWVR